MKKIASSLIAVIFFVFSVMTGAAWAEGVPPAGDAGTSVMTAAAGDVAPAPVADEVAVTSPGNVTVTFKGASIQTVLSYISEAAGVDIVLSPDVKDVAVYIKLTDKPWKTALDVILRNYNLAYETEGDIIRVVNRDSLQQEEPKTQTYTLNYGNAELVKKALEGMISTDNKERISVDQRTNTIIVTAQPANLDKIARVIQNLDKMTEQVLIETVIIETALGDNERLGIDWTAKISAAGAKRPTTFPFDYYDVDNAMFNKYVPLVQTGVATVTYDVGGQAVQTDPGLYPGGASGPSDNAKGFPFVDYTSSLFQDTFVFGTLDFSEFKAVLEMIKERSDTDIVSNPRILTLDNQTAEIHVGETVMLPKFERNSTTGKMEITGYEYSETIVDPETGKETTKGLKSGVNLRVTPHVNEKNEIVVDVQPSVSDNIVFRPLDPEGNIRAPQINERVANTQARINDGDTIFIGGLIHDTDEIIENKLPILGDMMGDVPYLGLLVNHKSTKKVRRELIVFITVHIIKQGRAIPGNPTEDKVAMPQFSYTQLEKAETAPKKKKWFIF